MQRYDLTIKANTRPETLERILRVIRHRGFEVLNLQAVNSGEEIAIQLTLQSQRDISLLTAQLEKLFDVLAVS
ncbi:acetolactate synthase 2 small subunit [Actinobacillus equuli subsp. equuli]|uniref:Acetolactate synthase 2 small subunit n=1 Tax=Actinobacillus equuli subsp. equuli TaxID=202947 RepID=A0A9X4JCQ9_ACTEU|nr:acetolactate synthase 2 small subunit [Actinobacillus equuli]MDE8033944.1 acetolactate synthase 2 small subunit [Actinobacillus equuli subsp. equuli]MDG4948013.1 acetolactate synthase 2 small subunit [Actinobacillus equuli subsp. haemolyticus]MDG4952745.1 acetolactate synthase 2 small subunit [Actinobacillus equuli subsp. equuli]WGE52073.1 acetolactate synthase 2 small subunit [Actinobacillus equuli subsp. haemolyticus]WGE54263.1 acetolactate synthase 2 small subunit [Actinobacillus equuli 